MEEQGELTGLPAEGDNEGLKDEVQQGEKHVPDDNEYEGKGC